MKGYKVFNPDWTCKGKQYSCPGIFEQEGELELCKNGIHFCRELSDCFNYYDFNPNNKVAEIEASGGIIVDDKNGRKCCTSKIKIIRELNWHEVLDLTNTGKNNTGLRNAGSCNTGFKNYGNFNTGSLNTGNYNTGKHNIGDWNTGEHNTGQYNTSNFNSGDYNSGGYNSGYFNSGCWNSGSRNSGDYNIGFRNTGNFNSGHFNSGHFNSGHFNSGHFNSGHFNSGDYNTSDFNTGDFNTGSFNTGSFNTGSFNTGDFNTGSFNFGCFNTEEDKIKFFNKQSDWTYKDWKMSKARKILKKVESKLNWIPAHEMTKEEKEEHPEYKIIDGFLNCKGEEELYSLRQEWWGNLPEEDKKAILNLPNFDTKIFKEITGIDVTIEK